MADHNKYPKLARVLAGTNGSESLDDLAEDTESTPQQIFGEYIGSMDEVTLAEIEESISANETLFDKWDWELPMEGDYEEFDDLAESNEGIRTLYNMIAERDGGDKFAEY